MQKCIDTMNLHTKLNMKPNEYTPHSLRVGGTTDEARNGTAGYLIEKRGRWHSKVWKRVYIKLDWQDISFLSNRPIFELMNSISKPFSDA